MKFGKFWLEFLWCLTDDKEAEDDDRGGEHDVDAGGGDSLFMSKPELLLLDEGDADREEDDIDETWLEL